MIETAPIMNPALKDFWLTQSRYKVLYGGRDSSKSWDAAINAVRIANYIPVRVLCTRMFQNRIEESIYTLVKNQIDRFGLSHNFNVLKTKISGNNGSEFLFYGIARNITEIKSLEGVDILILEEAHALTEEAWRVLYPTIRKESSEIWVIFNPHLMTDFAYQRFVVNPPEDCIVRKINYDENQFLSETSIKTIQALKAENYEEYLHVYEGQPLVDDESSIIKRKWLQACVDAHKKLKIGISGAKRIGFDLADVGEDKNATASRHGILINRIDQWKGQEDELLQSCSRTYSQAQLEGASIDYDSIGMGAGAGSKFKELNESLKLNVPYFPFNAGNSVVDPDKEYKPKVKNKDQFKNLKAQTWQHVADRALHTFNAVNGKEYNSDNILSISSECDHLEQLITELASPRKTYDGAGRLQVEAKKDMKKRGIASPNLADAFIMTFAPRLTGGTIGASNIRIL